ncbi:hypothetical protein [Jeotgalibacillus proteolyticus]|uniref:hypothetical protein n=1 Tax=Jeotgalibacillus proteolyticus TaxID=2082395 RepID=UPI003CFA61BC
MTEQEYIIQKAKTIKTTLTDETVSLIKVVELFGECLATQYHKKRISPSENTQD